MFKQVLIALLDASPSMHGTKYAAVIAATNALLVELRPPKSPPEAFRVGVGIYATTARSLFPPKPVGDVRPEDIAANTSGVGGSTNLTAALESALTMLAGVDVQQGKWARPVVLLLTDGNHNCGPAPEAAATCLKAQADLICAAFGDDADLELLKRLATTPEHAIRCTNGADLRQFFVKVGATLSLSLRTGQNAASLLGKGGVVRG